MWLCWHMHGYSLLLLLATSAGTANVGWNKANSNWNIDGSTRTKLNLLNEVHPVTSDVDGPKNQYPFVGDQWTFSASDGESLSLDLQINNSNQSSILPQVDDSWPYFYTGCVWLPINHIAFQFAHVFLCLSYLAPPGFYGLIYLRIVLAIGSALLAAWACVVICAFDTFVWNSLFLLVNAVHAVVLIVSLRTVHFTPQMEQVYADMFQPLKVSRRQFKAVVKCIASIRLVKRGEYFSIANVTKVETLSLLLSGSMLVSENDRLQHHIYPLQFLDSSDWFAVSSEDIFQVSIRACEESLVLLWHRDKLRVVLQKDVLLRCAFYEMLGRDVVRKHCQVTGEMASSSGSSLFKTNLMNNLVFVGSDKTLSLSSVLDPEYANKVDKSSTNVQKLLQLKQDLANRQRTSSNPTNTL